MPNPRTVDSFPAEYLEFLKRASLEQVDITLVSWREAFAVRAAINALRSILKKVDPTTYSVISKASVTIRTQEGRDLTRDTDIHDYRWLPYSQPPSDTGWIRSMAASKFAEGVELVRWERLKDDLFDLQGERSVILTGKPRNSAALNAFHRAGIVAPKLDRDPLDNL